MHDAGTRGPILEFLLQARVGDELTVRSTNGVELGGIRVVAWDSRTVSLAIGLPEGFQEQGQKIRLMERASQQFMPKVGQRDTDRDALRG